MKFINMRTSTMLAITIILCLSTGISLYTIDTVTRKSAVVVDLIQLKNDVLTANIALRNAAIATNDHYRLRELDKMLVTRESANGIYDRLTNELDGLNQTILNEMKKERMEYRQWQLSVANYIQKSDDINTWESMQYYQTLMDRYIKRIETILKSVTEDTEINHNTAKAIIIATLIFSIIAMFSIIWRLFR